MGTGGLWFCNVGHGWVEIADAVAAQMRELATYHLVEHVIAAGGLYPPADRYLEGAALNFRALTISLALRGASRGRLKRPLQGWAVRRPRRFARRNPSGR
jgi:adenosylmethionine-8-amino-7-oxononanoate aminotransferase